MKYKQTSNPVSFEHDLTDEVFYVINSDNIRTGQVIAKTAVIEPSGFIRIKYGILDGTDQGLIAAHRVSKSKEALMNKESRILQDKGFPDIVNGEIQLRK